MNEKIEKGCHKGPLKGLGINLQRGLPRTAPPNSEVSHRLQAHLKGHLTVRCKTATCPSQSEREELGPLVLARRGAVPVKTTVLVIFQAPTTSSKKLKSKSDFQGLPQTDAQ